MWPLIVLFLSLKLIDFSELLSSWLADLFLCLLNDDASAAQSTSLLGGWVWVMNLGRYGKRVVFLKIAVPTFIRRERWALQKIWGANQESNLRHLTTWRLLPFHFFPERGRDFDYRLCITSTFVSQINLSVSKGVFASNGEEESGLWPSSAVSVGENGAYCYGAIFCFCELSRAPTAFVALLTIFEFDVSE